MVFTILIQARIKQITLMIVQNDTISKHCISNFAILILRNNVTEATEVQNKNMAITLRIFE